MNENKFEVNLLEQIKSAVSGGRNSFVLWGINQSTLNLVDRMKSHGIEKYIIGIVDSDPKFEGRKVGKFKILPPSSIQELQFDTLVIVSDSEKEQILKSFVKLDRRKPRIILAGNSHLEFHDKVYEKIFSSLEIPSRAFGYKNMLIHLYQSLVYIAKKRLKGDVVEFGVYRGGTTVFLAKAIKELGLESKIYAFDSFNGFPYRRSALDMYDDPHDEFNDFQSVVDYCSPYNVELIKGDINETCNQIKDVPLVMSFFDTDNYSPAKATLEMCYKQTVNGGIIAFDHYFCDQRWLYTLGERIAASEFFADKNVLNFYGTGIFIKL